MKVFKGGGVDKLSEWKQLFFAAKRIYCDGKFARANMTHKRANTIQRHLNLQSTNFEISFLFFNFPHFLFFFFQLFSSSSQVFQILIWSSKVWLLSRANSFLLKVPIQWHNLALKVFFIHLFLICGRPRRKQRNKKKSHNASLFSFD